MKKSQAELQVKTSKDITELKKETDHLIVEKEHLFDNRVELEVAVADSSQYVLESTADLDVVARA